MAIAITTVVSCFYRYSPSRYTFFLLLTSAQRVFVYCSNFIASILFAVLPLIANRRTLQSLWQSLDSDTTAIITVTLATLFVAQATFTWTYSRIPFLFWNHMQNSRRLHLSFLQFAAQVSSAQSFSPAHLMQELKLWSLRHGQLLDARRALDATFNGPFGLLLCAVAGLAATLIVQLFSDKMAFDDVQTQCVCWRARCVAVVDICCRIVLFQLLNCSVYLVLIVGIAWRTFKMEQRSIVVFADLVAVLTTAATTTPVPTPSPQPPSLFSLGPEIVELANELMLKCSLHAPSARCEQQPYGYVYMAPLCDDVRDASTSQSVAIDCDGAENGVAKAEIYAHCSLHDVCSVASALLQRLSLMEAAKSSAHHTIFGIAVDTALLLSSLSFAISGIVSGLSTYFSK